MDITLQMRSIELLLKFIKHDLKDVPSYGYALQKPGIAPAPVREPFERATPESMGVHSSALEKLFREINAKGDELGIHGAMILRHGNVIAEGFWKPYCAELPHMLFSMSKTFVGTAIGIAADEGLLSVDELVTDIFKELATPAILKTQRGLRIRHLLTMSSGCRFNEVGSMLDENWAKMFLESAPKFDFGSAFDYNSINTYMLAAILCRKTGESLTGYLKPRLFDPLGIDLYHWENCPLGVEKGGWGLDLRLEDCAKLGQLYLQKGMWKGRRILSENWIEQATRSQIDTPEGEIKHGYGYQLWMADNENYLFNGAFGQYVLVMPALDVVAAFFGGSPHFFAEGPLLDMMRATFWGCEDEAFPEAPQLCERLRAYTSSLEFSPALPSRFGENNDWETLLNSLDGREYCLGNNTGGLFPQMLQAVHGNYTMGLDMLRFRRRDDMLCVDFYESYQRNTLYFSKDGFTNCRVCLRGEEHCVGAKLHYSYEPDGDIRLCFVACFLETPSTRIISMDLCRNAIHAVFLETPTVMRSSEMLLQLTGSSGPAYLKRLASMMKHVPGMSEETMDELIHHFTLPAADGALIGSFNDEEALRLEAPAIKALPQGS